MTRTLLQQALDALENVTQFAEAQICMHEETYRGGVLWEICSQCGAKWADDEGGKPKFKWPKETNAARKTITAIRSALAAPQPEPVAYVPRCHTDGNYCIVGEYKWDEIEEKPFGLADPAHWECAALYAAPPAAPAPAVPAECCRNELLTALHTLASNYENALGMFGQDGEGRRKAEGDLAHAMKVAAKHNRNGSGCAAPAVPVSWDRLRALLDGIPTREEFIGGQRQKYVAKEEVMGWLYEGQLRAEREAALSAAPAVREPQDERIRWRDAVIKEAESALRTAEQEFADMPTWANVGHAAKKVTHALAVIAAHGIGGGGNG